MIDSSILSTIVGCIAIGAIVCVCICLIQIYCILTFYVAAQRDEAFRAMHVITKYAKRATAVFIVTTLYWLYLQNVF